MVNGLPSVAHVLDRSPRANGNFEGAVLADLRSAEVRLEERAHLCITRATVCENSKVNREAEHIDEKRQNDQTNDSRDDVSSKLNLETSQKV